MHCSSNFVSDYLEALIDAILGQDGFICDDIGWCSRFNKGCNGVNDIDIGYGGIIEGTGTNNQVNPSNGASIEFLIIVVDVGRIT